MLSRITERLSNETTIDDSNTLAGYIETLKKDAVKARYDIPIVKSLIPPSIIRTDQYINDNPRYRYIKP